MPRPLHRAARIEVPLGRLGHRVLVEGGDERTAFVEDAAAAVDAPASGLRALRDDEVPPGGVDRLDEVQRVGHHPGGQRPVGILDPGQLGVGSHGQADDQPAGRPGQHRLVGGLRTLQRREAVPGQVPGWPVRRRIGDRPELGSGEHLSGLGTIVSWCTFYKQYYPDVAVPYDTIVVELEEGPLFISNPQGFTNEQVTYGTAVAVAFIDVEDEGGPFLLPVFERR